MLSIRVSAEIDKRLEELAKAAGRTKTSYAKEAIRGHLEDLYLSEKRLLEFRASGEKAISQEEILDEFKIKINADV